MEDVVYSEKSASGYYSKSLITKMGGGSNILHVIIMDKELILKTNLFMALLQIFTIYFIEFHWKI